MSALQLALPCIYGLDNSVDPPDIACHTGGMERRQASVLKPVHALRHEFHASHNISKSLHAFMVDDAEHIPLTIFSSKLRLLDDTPFQAHEYDHQTSIIKERLDNYEPYIYLNGRVAIKPIDRKFARIAFQVKDQSRFDDFVNDLDVLSDVRPNVDGGRHWLYTDVALAALSKSVSVRQQAAQQFEAAATGLTTSHYQWLQPVRLFEKKGVIELRNGNGDAPDEIVVPEAS